MYKLAMKKTSSPGRSVGPPANNKFNYGQAFGSNPWTKATSQISSMVNRLSRSLGRGGGFGAGGGSARGMIARPGDAAVKDYMSHVMGGQRNQLDEYVRRAAGAGISRSGLNVRGGPAMSSSLHHSAMKNLAAGYAGRFSEAMNYNKYLKATQQSLYQSQMSQLQSLLGTQHSYISSQADWRRNLANLKHSDWRDRLEYQRQAPFRQNQLARLKMDLKQDQWRNFNERREYKLNESRQQRIDRDWGRTLEKAAWGNSSWSPADHLRAERALTAKGVWKPLQRVITMKR
ncbi:hypothetical protein ACFL2Q_08135 [Thermodesulfobacteriota bacterium]